jgi:multimeric flavodoxin WrbA
MNVLAINGSPRKNWNTATLLAEALRGAEEAGARTEMIHLYDASFLGCKSCFACKRTGTKFRGACAVKDELSPILDKAMAADAIIIGSPIYLGNITGVAKSFIERLAFPCLSYDRPDKNNFDGAIQTAMIYTMGAQEAKLDALGYPYLFNSVAGYLKLLHGDTEYMTACDCLQFDDYSKYESSNFNAEKKHEIHDTVFAEDMRKAYKMGKRVALKAAK